MKILYIIGIIALFIVLALYVIYAWGKEGKEK